MGRIVVRQFGGEEIGEISQSTKGHIVVKAKTDKIRAELSAIVDSLLAQPLTLYAGSENETAEGIIYETVAIECTPGHPLYLRALADALLSPEHRVGDKRIRGIFEE